MQRVNHVFTEREADEHPLAGPRLALVGLLPARPGPAQPASGRGHGPEPDGPQRVRRAGAAMSARSIVAEVDRPRPSPRMRADEAVDVVELAEWSGWGDER